MLKLPPQAAQISSNEFILPKFWVFFTAPIPCYSVRDSRLKKLFNKKALFKVYPYSNNYSDNVIINR